MYARNTQDNENARVRFRHGSAPVAKGLLGTYLLPTNGSDRDAVNFLFAGRMTYAAGFRRGFVLDVRDLVDVTIKKIIITLHGSISIRSLTPQ